MSKITHIGRNFLDISIGSKKPLELFPGLVSWVGEEHRAAAKRRAWVKREEEKMQEERKAYWHAFLRGRVKTRGQLITM